MSHDARIHILTIARSPSGGIRTYLKYTYRYLNPEKYRFIFLSLDTPEARLLCAELPMHDITYIPIRVGSPQRSFPLSAWHLLRHSKIDLIHSQGLTAGILACAANMWHRVPHIVTPHDTFRRNQFRGPLGLAKTICLSSALRLATCINFVSFDSQQNFIEFLPHFSKHLRRLVVTPIGVDPSLYVPASCTHRRRDVPLSHKSPTVFAYIGRFMPEKGFEHLINAILYLTHELKINRNFRVHAIGEGGFIREYRSRIYRLGLSDYFQFFPFQPSIADLLTKVDAIVMPSLCEAAGLVAIEAFMAGCPLIASDCIGLREVTRDSPALVVRAGDHKSLGLAMQQFMQEPSRHKASAAIFAPVARQRFDSSRTAQSLDLLFDRLLTPDQGQCYHNLSVARSNAEPKKDVKVESPSPLSVRSRGGKYP